MRLYSSRTWQTIRAAQLRDEPLCRLCNAEGRATQATVADHIIPHRGNLELFYDRGNLQSLCKTCHDSVKKVIESDGYARNIGTDGWPIDDNHPVNKARGRINGHAHMH